MNNNLNVDLPNENCYSLFCFLFVIETFLQSKHFQIGSALSADRGRRQAALRLHLPVGEGRVRGQEGEPQPGGRHWEGQQERPRQVQAEAGSHQLAGTEELHFLRGERGMSESCHQAELIICFVFLLFDNQITHSTEIVFLYVLCYLPGL